MTFLLVVEKKRTGIVGKTSAASVWFELILLERMTEHHCTFSAELTMAGNWRLLGFLWPEMWQMCRSAKPAYDHKVIAVARTHDLCRR